MFRVKVKVTDGETMKKALLTAILIAMCSAAFGQESERPAASTQMGTAQQRAACRPDVRRFCRSVTAESGAFAFLACLQQHRDKLNRACRSVLESAGQ